ncbi:MAG TPA: hypothetical protein VF041_00405 [Gemmatimonadaceae bacterium]
MLSPFARRPIVLAASLAALSILFSQTLHAQDDDDSSSSRGDTVSGVDVSQLRWRFVGPQGNRVSAVIGEPGNPNVYYAGAASGGIWKSTDGGTNWAPIGDSLDVSSIGALAIAPSDHSIIWAGSGESFIRSNISIGDGVYRSVDGGRTWRHMGLEKTGRIARVIVNPHDPNNVFVCALGHAYGPQPERGVYRTADGGEHWERVLFVNDSTGCSDLSMDASSAHVLLAGMWQIEVHTWGKYSGGKGSGVYLSRDGGTTWKRLAGHGLPTTPVGKVAVAIAPTDPDRMYALMETGGKGSLWRSDDGGARWKTVSYSHMLAERPHYYTRMLVSPANENEVYFPSNTMMVTRDGGETTEPLRWGGDDHDMWADPTNADRMMIGFDGGLMITTNHGRGWRDVILPIAQMYHVAVDDRVPYYVYGNEQDYYSVRGPSNSRQGRSIPSTLWQTTAGCESGFSVPDPVDTNIVWGTCYAGGVARFDLSTGHEQSVDPWPDKSLDAPGDSLRYRWNWTMPLAISPHDHNTVYVGSQYVHRTTDGGRHWSVISPDLTTNDTAKLGSSGGLSPDNLGVEYFSTLFAIAESPVAAGVIWAGSNDGLVHVTRDGGAHWTDVTPPRKLLPKWGTISNIEPSRWDAGAAYISVDFHQVNDRDPYIFATRDYGRTWRRITNGIPRSVFSYVHVVREDPKRRGMLYAGTENGVYLSLDDGAHWQRLRTNLPPAPVVWMAVQERFDDLVVGTSGRGVWILDDLAPLRGVDSARTGDAHLFAPRPAYRFIDVNRMKTDPNDQSAGRNPPYGAIITYWLKRGKDTTTAPAAGAARGDTTASPGDTTRRAGADSSRAARDSVAITIRDEHGRVVRKLHGPARSGLNRAAWDLRWEKTTEVALRTTPPGHPHIWEEKRFVGKRTRPVVHYGIDEPKLGPLVAPGRYTVDIEVRGAHYTQPVTVLRDPHTAGSDADVQAAARFALEIHDEIDTTVAAINRIERVRKQLEELRDMYGRDSTMKPILAQAKALDGKLGAVEDQLLQPVLKEDDPKTYRAPMRVYTKLLFLEGVAGSGAGDVGGNPDFAPTAPELEVNEQLKQRLAAALGELRKVMEQDVPEFNHVVAARAVPVVGR